MLHALPTPGITALLLLLVRYNVYKSAYIPQVT